MKSAQVTIDGSASIQAKSAKKLVRRVAKVSAKNVREEDFHVQGTDDVGGEDEEEDDDPASDLTTAPPTEAPTFAPTIAPTSAPPGVTEDCLLGDSSKTWIPVSDRAEAKGNKRWCGKLSKAGKEICESSYTHRRCEKTAGGPTQFLKCVWNDDGQPPRNGKAAKPNKKCYADGAFTCAELGMSKVGVAARDDPCR